MGAIPKKGGNSLRTYELMYIAQPDLDEEGLEAVLAQMLGIITDNGGELVRTEHMGKRRLAYPIRRHSQGYYELVYANLEHTAIAELERGLKLSEDVIRHLLIRLDEEMEAAPVEAAPVEAAPVEAAPVDEPEAVEDAVSETEPVVEEVADEADEEE